MTSAPLRTSASAARRGAERRSTDPLAVLSRHLNHDCLHALQPQELAAILEAEGYTDALIQERYGDPSVFACAERLFQLVPYRPPTLARPAAQTLRPSSALRDLMRGVIYLLPAVWSPAVLALGWNGTGGNALYEAGQSTGLSNIQGAGLGLLISSFFGWGWMQSVAYLGYLGLATSPAEASRMLRWAGTGAVALTGVVAAAVALMLGARCGAGRCRGARYRRVSGCGHRPLGAQQRSSVGHQPAARPDLDGPPGSFLRGRGARQCAATGRSGVGAGSGFARGGSLLQQPPCPDRSGTGRVGTGAGRSSGGAVCPEIGPGGLAAGTSPRGVRLAVCRVSVARGAASLRQSAQFSSAESAGMLGLSWSLAPLVLSMGVLELSVRRIHAALKKQASTTGTVGSIVGRSAWQVLKVCSQYAALLFLGYVLGPYCGSRVRLPAPLVVADHRAPRSGGGAAPQRPADQLWGAVPGAGGVGLGLAAQLGLLLGHVDAVGSYALSAGGVLALLLGLMWLALMDIRNLG